MIAVFVNMATVLAGSLLGILLRKRLKQSLQDALMKALGLCTAMIGISSAIATADVLCISDFGWIPLASDTIEIINVQKQQGMRLYGLNIESESSSIINAVTGFSSQSPMDVCDSVWTYERGECKEIKSIKK